MRERQKWFSWLLVVLVLAMGGTSARAQTNFTVLHSFTNSTSDGSTPEGQPLLIGSMLYGVTLYGGSTALGTIFQIGTNGADFSVVYSFEGGLNGANPFGALTFGGVSLYGMTYNGGTNEGGVLFGIGTNGTGYTVLHTFLGGNTDGLSPYGSLVLTDTTLYGMTANGGTNDAGVVFKINTDATGFTVLHSFEGEPDDGSFPSEGVTLGGSSLYGTTYFGGSNDFGTVFSIGINGSSFKILHDFAGGTGDGANPSGPLALSGSTLYGITTAGGTTNAGTVFKINTDGTGYTLLHHFLRGTNDGALPQFGPLAVTNELIYGATEFGGATNAGVVFQMSTNGTDFTILHSFFGGTNDGAYPFYPPILSGPFFYGMTVTGGSNTLGVLYGPGVPPCLSVTGTGSLGVVYGNVAAGQSYHYEASGCIFYQLSSAASADPDGNISPDGCATFGPPVTAGPTFVCDGLKKVSLVGKINGGSCFQMGSTGSFTPSVSGTLTLYFNEDVWTDNSNSWDVCITPLPPTCTNVPAAMVAGTGFGTITAGHIYSFTATGTASYDCPGGLYVDPDGKPYGGFPSNSPSFYCSDLNVLSLVGTVNGKCIQLGSSGTFTAPSTGMLRLFMNDSIGGFGNNCGEWEVCITDFGEFRITAIATETNKSVLINWKTFGGLTNAVQVTPGIPPKGSYTNDFTDLSGLIIIPGSGPKTTNYTELGGVTNIPSRYYRVRIVP